MPKSRAKNVIVALDVPTRKAALGLVEEHMACGVGTCFGCVIGTVDPDTGGEGYSLVCTEGPVFAGERLRW